MNRQPDWQVSYDFFDHKPVVVEPQQAQLTSDAGLPPMRQLDEQLGLTAQFAAALKYGLQADRLSDHRYMAKLFRLYLHSLAANLLARLRGVVADPPPTLEEGIGGEEGLSAFAVANCLMPADPH
jgi:hypothetical protein